MHPAGLKPQGNQSISKGKHTNGLFQKIRAILKFDLLVFEQSGMNFTKLSEIYLINQSSAYQHCSEILLSH